MLEKSMSCQVLITMDSASSKTIEINHHEPRLQAVGELDTSAQIFMEEWQLWGEDEREETCRETNGEMLEERDGRRNCWRFIFGRRHSIPMWPKSDLHEAGMMLRDWGQQVTYLRAGTPQETVGPWAVHNRTGTEEKRKNKMSKVK